MSADARARRRRRHGGAKKRNRGPKADVDRRAPEEGRTERPTGGAPRPSAAALVAFVAFAWGLSLLAFDWFRREVFSPDAQAHLVLVAPIFAGAAAAAVAALAARPLGRRAVGGPLVHRLGLAAGLLSVTALALVVIVAPRLREADRRSRDATAVRQLEAVALALERHRGDHGAYPTGAGVESLAAALLPDYLEHGFALEDPWGRPLWYQSARAGRAYLLLSAGGDGAQALPAESYFGAGSATEAGDDLAVVSGRCLWRGGSRAVPREDGS